MKISDLTNDYDSIDRHLTPLDLDNEFNIYLDENNKYIYNLNSTLDFVIPESAIELWICDRTCQWTYVSYAIYGTTRLAWMLMKINKVNAIDIFTNLQSGDIVKYIDKKYINKILEDLYGV